MVQIENACASVHNKHDNVMSQDTEKQKCWLITLYSTEDKVDIPIPISNQMGLYKVGKLY